MDIKLITIVILITFLLILGIIEKQQFIQINRKTFIVINLLLIGIAIYMFSYEQTFKNRFLTTVLGTSLYSTQFLPFPNIVKYFVIPGLIFIISFFISY